MIIFHVFPLFGAQHIKASPMWGGAAVLLFCVQNCLTSVLICVVWRQRKWQTL